MFPLTLGASRRSAFTRSGLEIVVLLLCSYNLYQVLILGPVLLYGVKHPALGTNRAVRCLRRYSVYNVSITRALVRVGPDVPN
jgi:hypothetical protein